MLHKPSTAAWREIGGRRIYFRSLWEANYARWLEYQKTKNIIYDWHHEPKTFWFEDIKRGVRSYLPDFQVMHDKSSWHWAEVKGYMDAKSATKLKRMAKYHPLEKIILIDGKWFAANSSKLKLIIPDWEVGQSPKCKLKDKICPNMKSIPIHLSAYSP